MKKMKLQKQYITGFDGLRTIGVLGVVFYHLFPGVIKGGFLGVVLFFVISGYLITDLLLYEFETTKTIQLKDFYIRRLKRLYPLMISVLLICALYMFFFQSNMLNQMRMVTISSLFGFNNWWQISKGGSYFAKMLAEAPFTHFYSLAIEAQFYLFLPLFIFYIKPLRKKRMKIFNGFMIVSFLSALLMAVLYKADQDPTRIYYGTDTRLFSILLGSAVAFLLPSYRISHLKFSESAQRILHICALISTIIMAVSLVFMMDQSWIVYRGGMFLFSLACVVIVALCVFPQLSINHLLTNPIFSYLGTRSYGIYLWQIPLFTYYEQKVAHAHSLLHVIIQLVLLLFITELTYRAIEVPFRKMKWQDLKDISLFKIISTVIVTPIAIGSIIIILMAPDYSDVQNQIAEKVTANQQLLDAKNKTKSATLSEKKVTKLSKMYDVEKYQIIYASESELGFVGDSMFVFESEQLTDLYRNSHIEAAVGLDPQAVPDVVKQILKDHPDITSIVISAGINTDNYVPMKSDSIEKVMKLAGDRDVYWYNLNLTKSQWTWTDEINEKLKKCAKKYSNLHILDWYSVTFDKETKYLLQDGTHANEQGFIEYNKLLLNALKKQGMSE